MTLKTKYSMIVMMCFILSLVFSGCSHEKEEPLNEGMLSLEEVKDILEQEGLVLTETKAKPPIKEDLSIEPTAYIVNEGDGRLFIYQFNSVSSRKKHFPYVYIHDPLENADGIIIYNAKNISLIYEPNIENGGNWAYEAVFDLDNAVFYGMNDINNTLFHGIGDNWTGKIELEYFAYEWEDDHRENQLEYYGKSNLYLEFLNKESEVISELLYTYSLSEYRSSSSGVSSPEGKSILKEDNTYSSFISYREWIAYLLENQTLDITIKWNGHEENLTLTLVNAQAEITGIDSPDKNENIGRTSNINEEELNINELIHEVNEIKKNTMEIGGELISYKSIEK